MTRNWKPWSCQLGLIACFSAGATFVEVSIAGPWLRNAVLAQVTPDGTLNTTVNAAGDNFTITNGTARGNNLFHSFGQFSIPTGGSATFNLVNVPNITTIFSRVTGGSASNINGLIQTVSSNNRVGLFLMNPSGIVFGPNARLDISGSFVATTANRIEFSNQGFFSLTSNPSDLPLLTVNPSAFLFNQISAPSIANPTITNAGVLQVQPERSLLLMGGNVTLNGGQLLAPGGQIEIAAISGSQTVGLNVDSDRLSLNVPQNSTRTDISLLDGARIDVSAGGGGSIAVNAQNLNMTGVSILLAGIASDAGSIDAQAGNIDIDATGTIQLTDGSSIENSVQAAGFGNAGNVTIQNANTVIFDGESASFRASGVYSRVNAGAEGRGGQINITATSLLSVTKGAVITTSTRDQGDAGSVTIRADTVSFDGQGSFNPGLGFRQSSGAFSAVTELAEGQGGSVNVTARELRLTNGGALITNTLGEGNAGNVTINADRILFDGAGSDSDYRFSGAYSQVERTAIGQGGEIEITTQSMRLTNGGVVNTSTFGQGNAGNVTVKRADTIVVDGHSLEGTPSRLFADTQSSGDGGRLTINTRQLSIQNSARVSAETFSTGRAGTLEVQNAELVQVDGNGSVLNFDTRSQRANADAGDLRIFTQRLVVQNGAKVSARTAGGSDAGTLLVVAPQSVTIDGIGSGLFFDSEGSGNARGIEIRTGQLMVQAGGTVTLNGSGSGNPGNLNIAANSILLQGSGRITATTRSLTGGNIQLNIKDLLLMRCCDSAITTEAVTIGNGGFISIEAADGFVLARLSDNSDIVAGANLGTGGTARAKARAVLGFREFFGRRTPESDFTASSRFGFPGTEILITDERENRELPVVIPQTPEIAQGCRAYRAGANQSKFFITGRGGLPPAPNEALSGDAVQVDLVTRNSRQEKFSSFVPANSSISEVPIVEAQGWVVNRQGEIVLTAQGPEVISHSPHQTLADCQEPQSSFRR